MSGEGGVGRIEEDGQRRRGVCLVNCVTTQEGTPSAGGFLCGLSS